MPVDPVTRAQFRLALYRIERDWYGLARKIDAPDTEGARAAAQGAARHVLASADLFKIKPFFLSDEFSLVDATIAPMLWRLPRYEIDLPPQAAAHPQVREHRLFAARVPRQPVGKEREMRLA